LWLCQKSRKGGQMRVHRTSLRSSMSFYSRYIGNPVHSLTICQPCSCRFSFNHHRKLNYCSAADSQVFAWGGTCPGTYRPTYVRIRHESSSATEIRDRALPLAPLSAALNRCRFQAFYLMQELDCKHHITADGSQAFGIFEAGVWRPLGFKSKWFCNYLDVDNKCFIFVKRLFQLFVLQNLPKRKVQTSSKL